MQYEAFRISDSNKWQQLLKQAKKMTRIYVGCQILVIILGIIEPLLFIEVKDVFLLICYFIIWFAITFFSLQFRIAERIKAIHYLKKKGM